MSWFPFILVRSLSPHLRFLKLLFPAFLALLARPDIQTSRHPDKLRPFAAVRSSPGPKAYQAGLSQITGLPRPPSQYRADRPRKSRANLQLQHCSLPSLGPEFKSLPNVCQDRPFPPFETFFSSSLRLRPPPKIRLHRVSPASAESILLSTFLRRHSREGWIFYFPLYPRLLFFSSIERDSFPCFPGFLPAT